MNNKIHFATKLITALFILGFMLGSSSDPPNGRTGAPGDGVCSSCHSGNNFAGNITLSGLPETVSGGETYSLTVAVNNTDGNAIRAGFQMVSLFDDTNTNSGDYIVSNSDVGTSTAEGREYIEHRGAKNFQSDKAEWNFEWQAPEVSEATAVTMFAAGNIANGSGSDGDAIKFGNFQTTVENGSLPLEISVVIESEPACAGDSSGIASVIVDSGVPPYTYTWSTGATSSTESGLTVGMHSVTVTDEVGGLSSVSFEMTEPAPILIATTSIDVLCNGGQSGTINTSVTGGSGATLYAWSNGESTANIGNLSAGKYEVTVTDENGCIAVQEVLVEEPASLEVEVVTTAETAIDANDGKAVISTTGGNGPYSVSWEGGVEPALDNLEPGNYDLTVTDENGCSVTKSFSIISFECNFIVGLNSFDITCNGANDGEASVDPENFTQPLSIEWSTGESQFIFILGLSPGNYDVTLTDGAGCVRVEEFLIAEPEDLVAALDLAIPDCTSPEINQLEVTTQGGNAPYTYNWSNGANTSSLANLMEGNYEVTVTDANGCNTVRSQDVSYADIESPIIAVVDSILVYLDESGSSTLVASDYDLGTSDNCGIESIAFSDPIITCNQLESAEISYIATDESGNVDSAMVSIIVLDTIAPTAICVEDIIVNTCDTIFYDLPIFMDNCSVDSFMLAEGLPSGSIFPKDTTKVTYFFYDQSGNFGCCSFNVIVSNDLTLSVDTVINADADIGGSIEISVGGGSGNYTFEWVLNDTTLISNLEDVTNLDPGKYVVSVYDENGCFVNSESILIEFTSSIHDQFGKLQVRAYPNPSYDKVYLESEGLIQSLQVYGIQGHLLMNQREINSKSHMIDIDDLMPGLYFINLNYGDRSEILKIVKKNK